MRSFATKIDLPFNAVENNIIFGGGKASAVHRVGTHSFSLAPLVYKQALHGSLGWWAIRAETDFSVYRVCREYSAEEYVADTVNLIDERFADRRRFEGLLETHASRIRKMRAFTPEVYFVNSLQQRSSIPWSRASRGSDVIRDDEKSSFSTLTDYLPARRATTLEIQWNLRRAAVRGVCEPDTDPYWSPPAITL